MDMSSRDFGDSSTPELRLILVGNIGCGKTLTADTLLGDISSVGSLLPSRLCEVRYGESEGCNLRLVETPRWYWRGEHIDSTVQRETERALSLTAPGPHAFLILVPVGQFTEVEGRIPDELERIFGKGVLAHSLVLLTCGDYMVGRDMERYLSVDEPGLKAVVDRCGGRWHVINNRKPHDRQQVVVLLEKVKQLTQSSRGCYLTSAIQREVEERVREKERELQRKYSLREEVLSDYTTLSQMGWSDGIIQADEKKGLTRTRSLVETDSVTVQHLANGHHSQPPGWQEELPGVQRKSSSFKLSKEGAILSQISEQTEARGNSNNQNYVNSVHYQITSAGNTSSPSSPIQFNPAYNSSITSSSSVSNFSSSSNTDSSVPSMPKSSSSISSLSSSFITPSSSTYTSSMPRYSSFSNTASSILPSSTVHSSSSSVTTFSDNLFSSMPTLSTSPVTQASSYTSSSLPHFSSPGTTSLVSSVPNFFSSSSPSADSSDLRLVLLGRTGSGKSAAGNAILGRDEFKLRRADATGATTQTGVKAAAVIGKRKVVVVDTPDWSWSSCSPDDLRAHLSTCMKLCAPGPQAFLLCVPLTLPGRSNLHDLSTVKEAIGQDAILHHTLVLFTHSDHVKDKDFEKYIATKRPEMLELVERCGDRYHVLERGGNGGNVHELLEKVEQMIKESGGSYYSCQGQDVIGKETTTQYMKGRGGDDRMETIDRALSTTLHSLKEEDEGEQDEKSTKAGTSTSSSRSMLSSVLCFMGQKVGEGAKRVPKLVAGGALFGGVLGLFFGGPVGGAVGATAGTVAAEYGRRKYNKPKTA